MPLSALAEIILQPVFEIILHVFGYMTGYIVVPLFSFGTLQVERIVEKERPRPRLKNMRSDKDEPRMISADAATCFGLLFWGLVAVAAYLIKYHT